MKISQKLKQIIKEYKYGKQMVKELKTYERKYCSNCSRYGWYQKGYENGQKAGLQQGHDMIEKLLKEQQVKMDKLLAHEGEE